VDVSPVMGKGFNLAAVPVEEVPTLLLFATGSGIAPIRALIDSERLQVRQPDKLYYMFNKRWVFYNCAELNEPTSQTSVCLCQRHHRRQSRWNMVA